MSSDKIHFDIKTEKTTEADAEDEIVILENITANNYNKNNPEPKIFKKEPIYSSNNNNQQMTPSFSNNKPDSSIQTITEINQDLYEKIKHLELKQIILSNEINSLKENEYKLMSQIYDMNKLVEIKTNEIIDLKLKLNQYENRQSINLDKNKCAKEQDIIQINNDIDNDNDVSLIENINDADDDGDYDDDDETNENEVYITKIKLKTNQMLSENIWESLTNFHISKNSQIIKKNLNKKQSKEFDKIKNVSEQLIIENFKRNPTFRQIRKTNFGYSIDRYCFIQGKKECYWVINIKIRNNEATLSCNKDCQHKNPKKKSITNLFIKIIRVLVKKEFDQIMVILPTCTKNIDFFENITNPIDRAGG